MTIVDSGYLSLRSEWMLSIRNVQQAAVGDMVHGDLVGLEQGVRRLSAELPTPVSPGECLFLRQALVPFVDRCARHLHQRFHSELTDLDCGVCPPLEREAMWLSDEYSVERLLTAWSARYVAWFRRHHQYPTVWRATDILRERAAESWTTARLAREVGCCPTTLRRQFATLGLSPAEYLARVRVASALRQLRRGGVTVEDAAMHAGFRSGSKFYGRVSRYTGMTPTAVRKLPLEAFERVLEDRLSLRGGRRGAARRSAGPA
jgi:AraC-like DNA-binding protein